MEIKVSKNTVIYAVLAILIFGWFWNQNTIRKIRQNFKIYVINQIHDSTKDFVTLKKLEEKLIPIRRQDDVFVAENIDLERSINELFLDQQTQIQELSEKVAKALEDQSHSSAIITEMITNIDEEFEKEKLFLSEKIKEFTEKHANYDKAMSEHIKFFLKHNHNFSVIGKDGKEIPIKAGKVK